MGARGAAAPVMPDITVSAGGYLRLRREAQGLTIAEVAKLYTHSNAERRNCELLLEEVELDRAALAHKSLERLRIIFSFDPEVYLDLAGDIDGTSICLGCGCTWEDACVDVGHPGPCAWTDATERFCSSCDKRTKGAVA